MAADDAALAAHLTKLPEPPAQAPTWLTRQWSVLREGVSVALWGLSLAPYYWRNAVQRRTHPNAQLDVSYGPKPRQKLDVYPGVREDDTGEVDGSALQPILVFVHGGAWKWGGKDMHGLLARKLKHEQRLAWQAAGGGGAGGGGEDEQQQQQEQRVGQEWTQIMTVVPNYTLHPDGDVDEMLADLDQLMAWLTAHASELGGDPSRITLCGYSSGAHLASLLLLKTVEVHRDLAQGRLLERLHDPRLLGLGSRWQLRQVRAAVLLAGPYHIREHFFHEQSRGVAEFSPMKPAMKGFDHFEAYSPRLIAEGYHGQQLDHLDVHLVHGEDDTTVPVSSSIAFARALATCAVRRIEVHVVPSCGHTELVLPAGLDDVQAFHFHSVVRLLKRVVEDTQSWDESQELGFAAEQPLQQVSGELGDLIARLDALLSTEDAEEFRMQRQRNVDVSELLGELVNGLARAVS